MSQQSLFLKIFSGSFLVAGTAIGAGMLALPLVTAQAGFFPALIIYLACWLFSIATGLLMMEITMNLPEHSNLISMAKTYLGKGGLYASWLLYLFLFYCLTIAYISGGASMISSVLFSGKSYGVSIALFTGIFGACVCLGTKVVDRMNVFLMIGLIASYFGFIALGIQHVHLENLTVFKLHYAVAALPIIFTSFSYQGILPTLADYLKRDRKAMRASIVIGSTIPFVAYILWDLLIKGIIPLPELIIAKNEGVSAVIPLKAILKNSPITFIGQAFAFLALTTSFLGVTLGLLDFLADGLRVSKKGKNRLMLSLLIYFPSAVIAVTNPNIFFKALEYAGGIGCVLLLGLIPILMVFMKRYVMKERKGHIELFGGKLLLFILLIFILFELGVTLS
jgi:tyrosine-specific transport protein